MAHPVVVQVNLEVWLRYKILVTNITLIIVWSIYNVFLNLFLTIITFPRSEHLVYHILSGFEILPKKPRPHAKHNFMLSWLTHMLYKLVLGFKYNVSILATRWETLLMLTSRNLDSSVKNVKKSRPANMLWKCTIWFNLLKMFIVMQLNHQCGCSHQ